MRAVLPNSLDDTALREFWLQKLPQNIRAIVSGLDGTFSDVAERADRNTRSDRQFLIYSGADISVIPPVTAPHQIWSSQSSTAFRFPHTEQKNLRLNIGLARSFSWHFEMVDVSRCIIGADFLKYYGLVLDVLNRRLIDRGSSTAIKTSNTNV